MRTDEAIKHFGTQQALAKAIDCAQSTVAEWGPEPPLPRQLEIELASGGKLKANLPDEMRAMLARNGAAA